MNVAVGPWLAPVSSTIVGLSAPYVVRTTLAFSTIYTYSTHRYQHEVGYFIDYEVNREALIMSALQRRSPCNEYRLIIVLVLERQNVVCMARMSELLCAP